MLVFFQINTSAMPYNIVYLLGVKSRFHFIFFYELLFKAVRESLRLFEVEALFSYRKKIIVNSPIGKEV